MTLKTHDYPLEECFEHISETLLGLNCAIFRRRWQGRVGGVQLRAGQRHLAGAGACGAAHRRT